MRFTRRHLVAVAAAALMPRPVSAGAAVRLALTPVLLDNDVVVTGHLQAALGEALARPIDVVQRRTYQEVVGLLLDGSVDAAWLCGYPFLQHEAALRLLAVPVWEGRPLYQSYLIVGADDPAAGLPDLEGAVHAFSDPDSNSGWLVTASDLARLGADPAQFFARTIFCYGHRNVVRAVASGLARSGSVDGYVWEALKAAEPVLAERTRVIGRSEWLGFPPVVARAPPEPTATALGEALLRFDRFEAGRAALATLRLDRFVPGYPALYDGIHDRMDDVARP